MLANLRVCMPARMRACATLCVRVRARACACVRVRAIQVSSHVCTHACVYASICACVPSSTTVKIVLVDVTKSRRACACMCCILATSGSLRSVGHDSFKDESELVADFG